MILVAGAHLTSSHRWAVLRDFEDSGTAASAVIDEDDGSSRWRDLR